MDSDTLPEGPLTPPPDELKEVIELCEKLMDETCMDVLAEQSYLAIEDPEWDERIYCFFSPERDEVSEVLLFVIRGDEACTAFLDQMTGAVYEQDLDSLMSGTNGVYIAQTTWGDLTPEQRQRYKSAGITRKSRQSIPLPYSMRRGWLHTSLYRGDVDMLRRALEQCLIVAQSAWPPMSASSASGSELRVRSLETSPGGAKRWVDRWESFTEEPPQPIQDPDRAGRMANTLSRREDLVWEAEAFYVQFPIPEFWDEAENQEFGGHFMFRAPHYFVLTDISDENIGIRGVAGVIDDTLGEQFQPVFLDALESAGCLPREVYTIRGDVHRALEALCRSLGVRLRHVHELESGEAIYNVVNEILSEQLDKLLDEVDTEDEDTALLDGILEDMDGVLEDEHQSDEQTPGPHDKTV